MLNKIQSRWLTLAGLLVSGALGAAAEAPAGRDTLIYNDGDQLLGRLVEQTGETIVFKSERFGELRVPAAQAQVLAAKLAAPVANAERKAEPKAVAKPAKPTEPAEEEPGPVWEKFSPLALTAAVREFFGPWHGRFAFSTETVTDSKDRANTLVEAKLQRKWTKDEVQVNGRFDYNQTNSATTTDTVKGDALWRHDFPQKVFSQYRPTLEWNRASFKNGKPSDYVLLQQEVGAGVNVYNASNRKVRLGVSENLFDVWTVVEPDTHTSRAVESAFVETEWKLPWRMALTQRGVWYYSRTNERDGWESKVELNKKLTETLSAGVRHEIRRDSPDERVQDYTKLKLLLGLDF